MRQEMIDHTIDRTLLRVPDGDGAIPMREGIRPADGLSHAFVTIARPMQRRIIRI
jgi:hypothetical protein